MWQHHPYIEGPPLAAYLIHNQYIIGNTSLHNQAPSYLSELLHFYTPKM